MKIIKWFAVSALMTLFAACGGGGGNSGTPSFGTGSGTTTGTGTTGGTTDVGASLVLSISSTTASAATPATVTATVKSSAGTPITGQVVSFSSSGGLGAFNTSSGLTNANGQVAVKLTPASGTSNGADLVLAKTTVGTTLISGSIGFQVSPSSGAPVTGVPSVSVALSTASVTTATPATFTATVRDATGAVAPGQVVRFSTSTGTLGAFNVTSALTDTNGIATAKLTPASSTANGADLAIAQVTVANVLATGSVGFSVASSGAVTSTGAPSISLTLSTSTVTTATPATVTATVKDATGAGVVGQVVKFSTVDGLGSLTVSSALTDNVGSASTTLNAISATQSGADQVLATTTVNGTALQASQGFRLTAASVAIASLTADVTSAQMVSAYGQTGVQIALSGTVPGTPVSIAITSACIASGKATITPATASTTTGSATFTYRDNGCGATSATDTLRASIVGSAATAALSINVQAPAATSINFISAAPTAIYLKGSGFAETATITFRVLDQAGNGLPGKCVLLHPTTLAGGLVLNDGSGDVSQKSDSLGNVIVRVNSGTVPTPVRVTATLQADPAVATPNCATTLATTGITTVSSSLAIAVGLPSQLNFSLSQGIRNIEGFDIDGTTNTYNIIASDRLANPVPAGTAINFVAEGGSVQQIGYTTIDSLGISRTTANFVSASPRPADGRITVLAYALGEESFIDQNGNNVWDAGEPFQELGSPYLDRYFNGHYNQATDQYFSLNLPGAVPTACATTSNPLLALDVSIPSIPSTASFTGFVAPPTPTTCDGTWGKAYVRRAIQTVLSTSRARPVWAGAPPRAQVASCTSLTVGYNPDESAIVNAFPNVAGTTLYSAGGNTHSFLVSDANGVRLNPMAAGTTVSATATSGVTTGILGGSPVASTTEATFATFSVDFATGVTSGTVTLTFTSPGGLSTSVPINVLSTAGVASSPC